MLGCSAQHSSRYYLLCGDLTEHGGFPHEKAREWGLIVLSSPFSFIRGTISTVTGFGMASLFPLLEVSPMQTWDGLVGRWVERGLSHPLGYLLAVI